MRRARGYDRGLGTPRRGRPRAGWLPRRRPGWTRSTPDSGPWPRAGTQRGRRVRRRARDLVLHPDGPRRPDPRRAAAGPAAAGRPARRRRAVHRRVRHRRHHHRAGQRARPGGGLERGLGPGTGPRPRHVPPPGVRRAGRRGAVGLALRRPPPVAEQPGGGRRGPVRDPAVLRRRPGIVAAARPGAAAPAGRGRGPGPRAGPLARSRPGRTGHPGRPGAVRHHRRQPDLPVRRRPDDPPAGHLARPVHRPGAAER